MSNTWKSFLVEMEAEQVKQMKKSWEKERNRKRLNNYLEELKQKLDKENKENENRK